MHEKQLVREAVNALSGISGIDHIVSCKDKPEGIIDLAIVCDNSLRGQPLQLDGTLPGLREQIDKALQALGKYAQRVNYSIYWTGQEPKGTIVHDEYCELRKAA